MQGLLDGFGVVRALEGWGSWEDVQHMLLQASLFASSSVACLRHSAGHDGYADPGRRHDGLVHQWCELPAVLFVCVDVLVPVYTCAVWFGGTACHAGPVREGDMPLAGALWAPEGLICCSSPCG